LIELLAPVRMEVALGAKSQRTPMIVLMVEKAISALTKNLSIRIDTISSKNSDR